MNNEDLIWWNTVGLLAAFVSGAMAAGLSILTVLEQTGGCV